MIKRISGSIIAICILLINYSCSEDDSFLEQLDPSLEVNQEYLSQNIKHNEWIYQMMNHHYFWENELPDTSSLSFSKEPYAFFNDLLSPNDRFSWCELNQSYNQSSQELGFEYQTYEINGLCVNRVLYVYSSYLLQQGLKRGDYIIIDGDYLKIGQIRHDRFIQTKLIFRKLPETRGSNLAPTIPLDSIYLIDNKKIGYFIYDQFESSIDVTQIAMKFKSKDIDELILDLRYNPGGYVSTSNFLASVLVPNKHLGKLYQIQRFNDKITSEKKENGGSGVDSVFLNIGNITSQRNLDLRRIVVLITKNTASASEALIIGLRPYMDVITIGTTSCGKDVGSYTIADNRYKYQLQPITFRYYNALNDSTPTTGIRPNIIVEDDLNHERGDTNEALLKAAIGYILGYGNDNDNQASLEQSSLKEKEYGKSSIEVRNNL